MENDKLTPEQAIEKLTHCHTEDIECDHSNADDILCALLNYLGYADVVAEWQKINKWYA